MQTECTVEQLSFQALGRREVVARFDGGQLSSEGGGLLLREVEGRTTILKQFAACFRDYRHPAYVEHTVLEMVSQRVLGIALGYEDLNDHEQLRNDPLLCTLVDRTDVSRPLAGKSTLNRIELTPEGSGQDRYKKIVFDRGGIDALFVKVFLDSHLEAPPSIVLDLDTTDDAIHGNQEGRFFHGYYDEYCYLPLYIFSGDHLLCARLRRSNIDPADGTVEELARIVGQIRQRWPKVKITIGRTRASAATRS